MSARRIAVVGMACQYPDASSPGRLWENVLAGRRAFRRLPDERMRTADYYSPDPAEPDRFYSANAALIEGWEFDRVAYRVAGSTYRSTDLTHWLALDTTARALADAGKPQGAGLPAERTGVIIGNTLTGEFSRANLMRLRWPYVRRTVGAALREQGGWDEAQLSTFLDQLETRYKSPFPPINEDTLAGGLSNTIAGRICNHFDLRGGGYTVDGACSSSLLAVATGCNALANDELDVAIVGGVDLSIDPFEVIGFAKTGALATGQMRVYDRDSNGFWPGEGCGVLVLVRDDDARQEGLRRYATIAGWGYSSDGRGGITRPEAAGHELALRRAYATAGFGIDTVAYLEGHGTGTSVGDATELRALANARRAASPTAPPAAIGSIKGNIGHTKAAAGAAGLLKASLAVWHQVIPPATGTVEPHQELTGDAPALRIARTAEPWPAGLPVRAGVSSMGFGGINAHVVVEQADGPRPTRLERDTVTLARSRQDCELLLVDATDLAELRDKIVRLRPLCATLSEAELGDLAATLHHDLADRPVRAAVVAATPAVAAQRLGALLAAIDESGNTPVIDASGIFLATATGHPKIGFLFPGQGSGARPDGGALRYRFEQVDELYRAHPLPADADLVATAVAQPRIVTSSLAGLRALAELGIQAAGAAGHSLGELTALHWAGALDEDTVLDVATARGRIMAETSRGGGAMAGIAAPPAEVSPLLDVADVVIAGYNSPMQTVVSGPADSVARICDRANARGLTASRLPVSHAFHSDLVAPAAAALREYVRDRRFQPVHAPTFSTVTADVLAADVDVADLLARQIRQPVRFAEAVTELAARVDLLLEVGPGRVLSGLARDTVPGVPAIPLETDSRSLSGLLHAVAAAYVLGARVDTRALFLGRFARPLPLDKKFRFFTSPAESAPADTVESRPAPQQPEPGQPATDTGASTIEVLRGLAAERAELPLAAVLPESKPLDELHLSSIAVGQIVQQASSRLGLAAPSATSAYATSTLAELAGMLDELGETGVESDDTRPEPAQGVAPWVRAFTVDLVSAERPPAAPSAEGTWQLFAPEHHPIAAELHKELSKADLGDGVLLCLPPDPDEQHIPLMLAAVRATLSGDAPRRFVAVGHRPGPGALAKTLHLEHTSVSTTVVTVPLTDTDAVAQIVADVASTTGFQEVHYGPDGTRHVPLLRLVEQTQQAHRLPLGDDDVLLVTGGGKGITTECALSLAKHTGAALGLLGRSDPESDPELAANLERVSCAGVRFRYVRADVTTEADVRAAVAEIGAALGPVTAVLHGAGRNEPTAIAELDEESFRRTLAPKVTGLRSVLAALDPGSLRLLVSFGSIIGRAGLRGEADYATANDWLTELTERVGAEYPDCRCVALEWSVWSGTGMGERLAVLESLLREGISPIPAESGIAMLERILSDPASPSTLVIMGRAGDLPTIALPRPELPLLRFLDQPRVYYPGIELVVDTDLSTSGDHYLTDHELDGDILFPAVFGMEAMVQAATALVDSTAPPLLEDVEFLRPIVIPPEGNGTIRVAALVTEPGVVRVVVRAATTDFHADHFRATVRFAPTPAAHEPPEPTAALLPLRPDRDLYGPILFQGPRFQRLLGYHELAATHCVARISNTRTDPWFGAYLPDDLVLADPGTRDCVMHAIQCCVPDATLLPEGVERLFLADPATTGSLDTVTTRAVERGHDGDTYVYDVDVHDDAGVLVEQWRGLRLRAVRKRDGAGPWPPALLSPYLERNAEPTLKTRLRCVVWPDDPADPHRKHTELAARAALGPSTTVRHRPDGKPELDGAATMSAAHGAGVTLVVVPPDAAGVGCDVEPAEARDTEDWGRLLGAEQLMLATLLAREHDEPLSVAATRVWCAIECLRKNGQARVEPITVDPSGPDRWVLLRSGTARIATFPTALAEVEQPVVFAMLIGEGN